MLLLHLLELALQFQQGQQILLLLLLQVKAKLLDLLLLFQHHFLVLALVGG